MRDFSVSGIARQLQNWDQNLTPPDVEFCAQWNEVRMIFFVLLTSSKVCICFIYCSIEKGS